MTNDHTPTLWRSESDAILAAMDHVRLSYCYLDDGDVDAYCSLFTEHVVLRLPGTGEVIGRAELERIERHRLAGGSVRHLVFDVFGSGHRVAAVGRLTRLHRANQDFVDVFTVAQDGLLSGRTTYLMPHPG